MGGLIFMDPTVKDKFDKLLEMLILFFKILIDALFNAII